MMICILCEGTNGGTGTLAIRVAKWCKKTHTEMAYCAIEDTNSINTAELKSLGVNIVFNSDKSFFSQFEKVNKKNKDVILLSYSLRNHYMGDCIRRKAKNVKTNILYQVGPDGVSYVPSRGHGLKGLVQSCVNILVFRLYLKKIIKHNEYRVIDEQCRGIASKSLRIEINKNTLLRLPYEITEYDAIDEETVEIPNVFSICTVCRMSFPLKGYVMGLVDLFQQLIDEGLQLELIIIGDGNDKALLEEKVHSLTDNVSSRITLFGNLSYDSVRKAMSQSSIYIGMGTTIFDAVDSLTIAIPVAFDTFEIKADHFFSDDPSSFTSDDQNGTTEYVKKKIMEVYKLDNTEYIERVREQHRLLKEFYDTNVFIEGIIGDFD